MEIKKLPDDVTNRLRSDIQINTFPHCVAELVLNSLDAKSTAIAVRINLQLFRIEVIDNGTGINASNMELIGSRYMTSKYDIKSERRLKCHGYKGEALASIISAAKQVEITSRFEESNDTYYKKFTTGDPGDVLVTKQRPSKGTTVTVTDFLYNCPVRQHRVKKIDINDIQKNLELLAIIHPGVSITLRNDQTCDVILNCAKTNSVSHALSCLYKDLKVKNFCEIKVAKGNIHITGLFYLSAVFHPNLQLFYINKLPVTLEYLQKHIKLDLHKNLRLEFITTNCHPVYVINISCPYSKVDVHFNSTKYLAEFKSWDVITKCVEKMVKIYIEKYEKNKNKSSSSVIKSTAPVKQNKTLGMRYKQKKTIETPTKLSQGRSISFECLANKVLGDRNDNFLGMFDENYDSQDLTFKRCSLDNLNHNEREGKKIIMDAYFKSITGESKNDDNIEGKVIEMYDNTLGTISNKSFDKSEKSKMDTATVEVNREKTTEEKDISLLIKQSGNDLKKRRLERLNGVGMSVIEKKLKLQIECQNLNKNPDKIKASDVIEIVSCQSTTSESVQKPKRNNATKKRSLIRSKTIPESPIILSGSLRRSFSNKAIQTSPPLCMSFHEKSVQVDLLKDEFKFPVKLTKKNNNNNNNIKILDDVRFIPGLEPIVLKHTKENIAPLVVNLNTTFNSHYNASKEFNVENNSKNYQFPPKITSPFLRNPNRNLPVVEMNTQKLFDEITTSNLFKIDQEFKRPRTPDIGYEDFTKGLKTSTPKCGDTSKFFEKSDFKIPNNPINVTISTNKNTTVVFADTSMFNFKTDKFRKPNIDKNLQNLNENDITFGHFEPVFKSTAKEPKYTTKNNFFESFLFEEKKVDKDHDKFFDFGNETNNVEGQFKNAFFEEFGEDLDLEPIQNREPLFGLKKRYDFMPKGLSPILKETKVVDVTLSPTSKKQLNNAIIESYENELELIKWQDYLDGDDPREFFNEIYTEKQKLIEKDIPNVTKTIKNFTFSETGAFSKDIFDSIVVIGQLDRKFIVTILNSKVLLLFDQHAVHERIKLEQLLNDYTIKDTNGNHTKFKSIFCNKFIKMQFNARELQCLKYCKDTFENLGFLFDIHSSSIEIKKIPECVHKKHLKESDDFLHNCVKNIFNEEISVLEETRGVSKTVPKMMQYIISSEACRGAIKFGQVLTNEKCSEYINLLSKCQLPFQCAHGRPTLYPIFEINNDVVKSKINFHRL